MTGGSRLPRLVIEAGGLAQGIVLVAFPASEPVLRRADDGFGLSSAQYGQLFIPQVVLAITASLLGGQLSRRLGLKRVLLAGLAADAAAMALLAFGATVAGSDSGHLVLLVATGFLGAGFGFTVPTLNSFAADLAPSDPTRAVLTLNALLGLGTALAPVFGALFLGLGIWWGLPLLCAGLALATALAVVPLTLPTTPPNATPLLGLVRRPRLMLFIGVAIAYGVVETMAGNWGVPLAGTSLRLSTSLASVVLAVFWATVTAGRLAFAGLERRVSPVLVYRSLPWVVAVAFALVLVLPTGSAVGVIVVFTVVGVGCSALLPSTVSFAQSAFPAAAAAVSAIVIAAYQVGYGIAAFGVGPLQDAGVDLTGAYGIAAIVAASLGIGAVVVTRDR